MIRSPNKCNSDPYLIQYVLSDNCSPPPPNFVNSRIKRKRCVKQLSDFEDFKQEMRDLFATLMTQQKDILATNQDIEKSISFLSSQYDDLSRKVCDIEEVRRKDLEYIMILEDKIGDLHLLPVKRVRSSGTTAFQNISDILNNQGSCFAIVGGKESLFDAYRTLAKTEKWKPWLIDVERYISPYHDSQDSLKEMQQLLGKIGFTVKKLEDKIIVHNYENQEDLKSAIMSVLPFKIPDELYDDFFIDLSQEMHMFDTEKYNYKNSTNDFVLNVQILVLYVEKKC
ncbi:unnamed protein product [Pieris brassicae]|uniref:Uncharacterized protein n=1 Tax=Pieris brassicae TaxID=7116 RepID=A0A9P0TBV4_PIEBR|nr:unnamed protein product [Pieris brassicae]